MQKVCFLIPVDIANYQLWISIGEGLVSELSSGLVYLDLNLWGIRWAQRVCKIISSGALLKLIVLGVTLEDAEPIHVEAEDEEMEAEDEDIWFFFYY